MGESKGLGMVVIMSMGVYWLRQRGRRGVEMAEIVCVGGE